MLSDYDHIKDCAQKEDAAFQRIVSLMFSYPLSHNKDASIDDMANAICDWVDADILKRIMIKANCNV